MKCFKKQLDLAWEIKDTASELDSYDNIGMQCFYMGNMQSAKYYHSRMMEARKEPPDSEIRQYRHKLIGRMKGKLKKINEKNLKDIIKAQFKRNYDKSPERETIRETDFAAATTRFYTKSRQGSRQQNHDFDNQRAVTAITHSRGFEKYSQPEKLLSPDPADLSLSDLPSLENANIFENKPDPRKELPKCPELIMYLNKQISVFFIIFYLSK